MKYLHQLYVSLLVALTAQVAAQDAPQLEIEKYQLSNGLEVIFYENHSMPKVSVNIVYDHQNALF